MTEPGPAPRSPGLRSLFVRFVVALGVGHAVGVLVWVVAATLLVPWVAEAHLVHLLEGPTAAMVAQLRDAPPAERDAVLAGWTADAAIVAPSAITDADAVRRGELGMAVSGTEVRVYRAIDEGAWLALGPLPLLPPGAVARWASLALFATVGIATGAMVALRPVQRNLGHLAHVARAFGAGDLTARARLAGPAELEQVGDAFDAMADRIHALLRQQQETLQGVSHELRTPLTRARFALELVATTDDPESRRKQAERAAEDLDQMERLLGELLSYLRLEALRQLHPVPTELSGLVAALVDQRVAVEVVGTAVAEVEPELLRRALRNLIANAARHATSRVVVRVATEGGEAVVHVDDDGPGIPAGERERLLQPFRRGDAARRLDPAGSGLGLPIAARVVAAHGGRLEVGDSPVGGARVSLFVPLRT